jgi:hypothetical protein
MATPTFILPSAPTYTEGFVNGLNVYPDPTNFVANQVPFTRATTATRTNAAGLIELVPYNLVQYSEQFSQGIWIKDSTNVLPNTIAAPDGTMTADTIVTNAVSQCLVRQSISFNVSQYTLTIYAKKGNIAFNYVELGNSYATFNMTTGAVANTGIFSTGWTFLSATSETLSNGWYRFTLSSQCTTAGSYGGVRPFHAMSAPGNYTYPTIGDFGYIWGAQVVEGTDALPYQLTETRLNRPRVDFSLGGCPNLLLEPQRTNLITYSEQFDDAYWFKNAVTITANSVTAPNGILTADSIVENTANTDHYVSTAGSLTLTAAPYTFSIYCKKATRDWINVNLYNGTDVKSAWFNLNTGTIGTVQSGLTAAITDVGNGWYRCSITRTMSTGINYCGISPQIADNGGTYLGNGSTAAYIWGAQLEEGAYPTTYIPTSSASVTRNTDTFALSNVFTNNMISSAGGTWFVDLRNNIPLTRDAFENGIFLGDESLLNSIRLVTINPGRTSIVLNWGMTFSVPFTTTADNCKLAFKFNGSTLDIFQNGIKVVSATTFAPNLSVMQNLNVSPTGTPKIINSMALYNTPLTDDELEVITGEGFDTYALMASNYNYILQ